MSTAYDFVPNQDFSACIEVGGQHRNQSNCESTCIADYALFEKKIPSLCPTDATALKQSCADYCSLDASKAVGLDGQCYTGYHYQYTPTPGPNPATTPPEYCREVCQSQCEANCPAFIGQRNMVQSCKFDICPGSLPSDYNGSKTTDVIAQQRLALYKPITTGEFPHLAFDAPCHYFNEQSNEWEYTLTFAPTTNIISTNTPNTNIISTNTPNTNIISTNTPNTKISTHTFPPLPIIHRDPPLPVSPSTTTTSPTTISPPTGSPSTNKSDWLLGLYIALGIVGCFLFGVGLYDYRYGTIFSRNKGSRTGGVIKKKHTKPSDSRARGASLHTHRG